MVGRHGMAAVTAPVGGRVADRLRRAGQDAERGFTRSLLQAIVVLRWLTLTWAVIGVVLSTEHLDRPGLAWATLAALAVFTLVATGLLFTRPDLLTTLPLILIEVALAAGALLIDTHVFDPARAQSLVWAWPAAAIMSTSVFVGAIAGGAAAVGLGVASFFGDARISLDSWGAAASSKTALFVLAALLSAYVARRLRRAEREIGMARAREDVARTLHDGVLQTLAVVQRRSTDPELAALAAQQDRELRDYLYGVRTPERTLPVALRDAAELARSRYGLTVDVIAADDLPDLPTATVEALSGAVGEALTNVGKHAEASRAVVYAEPDDDGGVFCSVKDDGRGFDTTAARTGQGLTGSIDARIRDVGGRSSISSHPDRGTEVQLWTP